MNDTTTRDSLTLGLPIGLALGVLATSLLLTGFFAEAVALLAAGFVAAAVTLPFAARNARRRKAAARAALTL